MKNHDQELRLKQIRQALDQSVAQLDSDTRKRLDSIRGAAVIRQLGSEPVNDSEESLLMAARAALDDSVESLDPEVLARLNDDRKTALLNGKSADHKPGIWQRLAAGFKLPQLSVPVGAFATACVLVTVAAVFYQVPNQSGGEVADADIILFASSDEIELYDNLEFYLWLADNGLPN